MYYTSRRNVLEEINYIPQTVCFGISVMWLIIDCNKLASRQKRNTIHWLNGKWEMGKWKIGIEFSANWPKQWNCSAPVEASQVDSSFIIHKLQLQQLHLQREPAEVAILYIYVYIVHTHKSSSLTDFNRGECSSFGRRTLNKQWQQNNEQVDTELSTSILIMQIREREIECWNWKWNWNLSENLCCKWSRN